MKKTLHLNMRPEQKKKLKALASSRGVSVSRFVSGFVAVIVESDDSHACVDWLRDNTDAPEEKPVKHPHHKKEQKDMSNRLHINMPTELKKTVKVLADCRGVSASRFVSGLVAVILQDDVWQACVDWLRDNSKAPEENRVKHSHHKKEQKDMSNTVHINVPLKLQKKVQARAAVLGIPTFRYLAVLVEEDIRLAGMDRLVGDSDGLEGNPVPSRHHEEA